jgi:hypothetical protein
MLEYTNSAFQASARAYLAGVGTHAHRSSCASTNKFADPKKVDPFFHFMIPKKIGPPAWSVRLNTNKFLVATSSRAP